MLGDHFVIKWLSWLSSLAGLNRLWQKSDKPMGCEKRKEGIAEKDALWWPLLSLPASSGLADGLEAAALSSPGPTLSSAPG